MRGDVQDFYVYLLECCDGSLYTGIALDVARRVDQHNRGKGAKYTRGRGPVRVVAVSGAMKKGEALRLELQVKKLDRHERAGAITAANTKNTKKEIKPRRRPRAAPPRSRSARR